jgi:hypothetical protein
MRRRHTLGLVAATSVFLVGCGASIPEGAVDAEWQAAPEGHPDHDPVMPVGPGGDLEIEAGSFFFEVVGGQPVTGEIEVTGINVSNDFHDIHFTGAAEGSEIIEMEGGESDTGTVLLFPGETTIWCDVPGHREAGMEDTVTVFATEEEAAEAAEEGDIGGGEDGEDATGAEGDGDAEAVDPAAGD